MRSRPTRSFLGYEDVYSNDMFQHRTTGVSHYDKFTVQNGEVRGDRIRPNPISYTKEVYTCEPFEYVHWDRRFAKSTFKGIMRADTTTGTSGLFEGLPPLPASPVNANAYDGAYAKAMSKVRSGSSQILIDAAEWKSTRDMVSASNALHKRVAGVFEHLHRYAKSRSDRDRRLIDAVASRYLEMRYGWQPLIGSVYDALDNLHREVLGPRLVSLTARSGSRETLDGSSLTTVYSGEHGTIKLPFVRFSEDDYRCELSWDIVVPGEGIWDWTSLNPASIAWELLPLSFVADWFITVGQSLENLENWVLWKAGFAGGYVTYTCRSTRIGQVNATRTKSFQLISRRAREVRVKVMKDRQVLSELPLPNPPRVRINLNSDRVLDAAALLKLAIGRKLRAIDALTRVGGRR